MSITTNLFASGLTIVLILLLRPLARRLGIVDHPGGRKRHEHATPLVGGLAFFLGLVITVVFFRIAIPSLTAYLSAATLLVVTGLLDDRFDLPARWRLLVQVVAALIMILEGDLIVSDFGDWFGLRFNLGPLAVPFTIFAVVGLINAFNMLDGLDGLAGLVSVSLLAVVGLWANTVGATEVENLAYLLLFAVSGFLLFNLRLPRRPRALVFMGDAGSMLLGLSFAWMVVALAQRHSNGTPMAAFWLVAFPILETANVMLRRKLKGRPVYKPDHEHLHYICQQCGLSINRTVLLLSSLALSLGSVGLIAGLVNMPDWLLALGLLSTGILYYRVADHFTLPRERTPISVGEKAVPSQKV
ncbi:MAG: MraY family glycosyltransferase [Candidatus Competibacteraceae bacterium]